MEQFIELIIQTVMAVCFYCLQDPDNFIQKVQVNKKQEEPADFAFYLKRKVTN